MPRRITPRVGLLPLILKLYDETLPELREKQRELVSGVQDALSRFATVQCAEIANCEDGVRAAAQRFDADGCDAIVVLFTAYAPSLIARDALADSPLPIVIFNTQVAQKLDRDELSDAMLRNHGMHGVQDLANVMLRKGRPPHIVTGHFTDERALSELEDLLRACAVRRYLRGAAVGVMGTSFEGMGDFQFDPDRLSDVFGTRVEQIDQAKVAKLAENAPPADLPAAAGEMEVDDALSDEELAASEALSAAVLRTLDEGGYCAWSMNFLDVGRDGILKTVPFLAAARSMVEGYGYAGEGDALSAMCVFIAAQLAPPATFTEMFSMDPATGSVLMSHMGEANYALAGGPVRLACKEFRFGDVVAPATPVFALKAGEATLINLIEGPEGFRFIAADCTMQAWRVNPKLDAPQGFMRPDRPLEEFLTAYSELGGSHHLALTYGRNAGKVARLAALCGVECFHL